MSKFEQTLQQVDEKKKTPKKEPKYSSITPNKPNENSPPFKSEKQSLSSKLSSKVHAENDKLKSDKTSPTKSLKQSSKSDEHSSSEKTEQQLTTPSKSKKDSSSGSANKKSEVNHKKTLSKSGKKSSNLEITIEKKSDKKTKDSQTPNKKDTPSKEESEEAIRDEWAQKKKQAAANYRNYLQKVNTGAKNPGCKVIPEGEEGCLAGLTFVQSGVYESLDRPEMGELIKKYGGKVTTGVSGKTDYLVLGDDGGQSKITKAEKHGTKIINEDDLLEMIKMRSGRSDGGKPVKVKASNVKTICDSPSPKKSKRVEKSESSKPTSQTGSSVKEHKPTAVSSSQESNASTQPLTSQELTSRVSGELMWVDKYKPATLKNVIGQQGDKSNARKLLLWLRNWFNNQSGKKKLVKPAPWAKDHDGSFFKAALLSGPPGVGKTTSAQLVCKELGYDTVELNASDTRSKKSLTAVVSQLLGNTSLNDFAFNKNNVKTTRNHVLLMDEVDGMAGNEDRGGVQELIQLIKGSKVPIICMCNDRQHPKIRSLANYCFDLRFYKPRVEQIRGAMMSVCFREGIKLKPDALDQIIMGSNQDVRQVLHHLSMFSAKEQTLDSNQVKTDANKAKKDLKIGPWDVCRQVFNDSDRKNMTIHQKADLFFHDYSIGPLFVQENYWKARPKSVQCGPKSALLKQVPISTAD